MNATRHKAGTQPIETLFRVGSAGNMEDGPLLERFRTHGDAEAFRVLVERYGAIVMSVCRSVLGDVHRADDAFQATFLVLVPRAGGIRAGQSIGPWLHGVALRVARRARSQAARRLALEKPLGWEARASVMSEPLARGEELEAVHQELARLPESLRAPLILCCLEELSYEQAARRLGVREPTLRGRLHRGRKRLVSRLKARGLGPSAFLPAGARAARLIEPVAQPLVGATVALASKWLTVGPLAAGAGPAAVCLLAQGVLRTMIWDTIKLAAIPALVAATALGTVVLAQQGRDPAQPDAGRGGGNSATPPTVGGNPSLKRDYLDAETWRRLAERRTKRSADLALLQKTKHIRDLLARKCDLELPGELSLSQFLKTVKAKTATANYPGIPIYVEPEALRKAGHTLETKVKLDQHDDDLLGWTIERALKPLDLGYDVQDGFLRVDSRLAVVEFRLDRLEKSVDQIEQHMEKVMKLLEKLKPPG